MEVEQTVPATSDAAPPSLSARQVPVLVWVLLTFCMAGLLGFLIYRVLPDYFELLDRFVASGLKLPIGLVVLEAAVRPLYRPQIALAVWAVLAALVGSLALVKGRVGQALQRIVVFGLAAAVMICMVAWVQMLLALRAYVQ